MLVNYPQEVIDSSVVNYKEKKTFYMFRNIEHFMTNITGVKFMDNCYSSTVPRDAKRYSGSTPSEITKHIIRTKFGALVHAHQ